LTKMAADGVRSLGLAGEREAEVIKAASMHAPFSAEAC
jgi:hypothetical protein